MAGNHKNHRSRPGRSSRELSVGGKTPIPGEIFFGGKSARPNFRIAADDEGTFTGFVSEEREWPVEVILASGQRVRTEPVDVSVIDGTSFARVDIELPDTSVSGIVTSRGEPTPRAFVAAFSDEKAEEGGLRAVLSVDRAGEFEILGAQPGTIRLRAYSDQETSRWKEVELAEGRQVEGLRLELGETYTVRGRVETASGPTPGAIISPTLQLADSPLPIPADRATTQADGYFELQVDERALSMEVVAVIPGCGIELLRFSTSPDSPQELHIPCSLPRGTLRILSPPTATTTLQFAGASFSMKRLLSLLAGAGLQPWDSEGLAIQDLRPGIYSLCDGATCDSGTLEGFADLSLDAAKRQDGENSNE